MRPAGHIVFEGTTVRGGRAHDGVGVIALTPCDASLGQWSWRSAAWVALSLLSACGPAGNVPAAAEGDAQRGRELLHQYGCSACHRIPGVRDAIGNVGPPLDELRDRVYVAGSLPNSPPNLVRWIRSPQELRPGTVMPNLGVPEQDAQDMAAYLHRLH